MATLPLEKTQVIPYSDAFKEKANHTSDFLYEEAKKDPLGFWENQAKNLHWFSLWDTVLKWDPPYAQWFTSGKLNASYNCLDRHKGTEVFTKTALFWEGERGEERTLTYEDLYNEVNRLSNVLKQLGIKKGDRVAIYLPMIPESIIAMQSCARIGAVHTVVFGGFSAESLQDRIQDAEASLLITADGGFRRGHLIALKEASDSILKACPTLKHRLIVRHAKIPLTIEEGFDYFYDEQVAKAAAYCPPEVMDAEDLLYILYTSGTTGKPKGILHTTGGYLVGVATTTRLVFDIKKDDIYWCTADIGWVTGHSYVAYGPLVNGMTQLIYEGAPDFPDRSRFWQLIEKYKVSILYTAPTAIRTFMKWGESWIKKHDLSSLRLLGSVGEPINPEAWMWYYTHIGNERCPVIDTWWQTETGSILIAPLPGVIPLKPGSATKPLPGIEAKVLNDAGEETSSGYLVITSPWPSMLRGIYKDPKRYEETYWKRWDGNYYFTGDGAKCDSEGYYWLMGRVDDVINISGHRLGTMEIESALVDHPFVAEAAAIAISHPIKGQVIAAFVILKEAKTHETQDVEELLKGHVVKKIGAIARPEKIFLIPDLPKTRSGKILRRLLRDLAEGRALGDMTTLSDPGVLATIKASYEDD